MANIASKNLYELLGNDPELDPDLKQPEQPTKAIDKTLPRSGKRNVVVPDAPPREVPAPRAGSGGYKGNNNNESAFRDRGVGSNQNRTRGTGELGQTEYRGRGRGSRGSRGGGAARGDRHSRTGVADHEKQVAHGWGANSGEGELADEKAGEAIAKEDEKADGIPADVEGTAEDAAEEEPEDKSKSYAAYLAELAEKKLSLAAQNIRSPNEGTSAKFPEGKPLARDEEEDVFIAGSGGKAKRERQRKEKAVVELDDSRLHSAPRDTFGGRGGRGGRGRGGGEFRGGEGRGRGGQRGRGETRGRGGRGGQSGPNVTDPKAFPSLGA